MNSDKMSLWAILCVCVCVYEKIDKHKWKKATTKNRNK